MGAILAKLGTALAFEGIRAYFSKDKVLPEKLIEFDGNETDFINEMLEKCEWVAADNKDILTTYIGKDGVTIGMHVRWPNRTYCYVID